MTAPVPPGRPPSMCFYPWGLVHCYCPFWLSPKGIQKLHHKGSHLPGSCWNRPYTFWRRPQSLLGGLWCCHCFGRKHLIGGPYRCAACRFIIAVFDIIGGAWSCGGIFWEDEISRLTGHGVVTWIVSSRFFFQSCEVRVGIVLVFAHGNSDIVGFFLGICFCGVDTSFIMWNKLHRLPKSPSNSLKKWNANFLTSLLKDWKE